MIELVDAFMPHLIAVPILLPLVAACVLMLLSERRLPDGGTVALDAGAGTVTAADGSVLACEPIPAFLLERVRAGGLFEQLKHRFAQGHIDG